MNTFIFKQVEKTTVIFMVQNAIKVLYKLIYYFKFCLLITYYSLYFLPILSFVAVWSVLIWIVLNTDLLKIAPGEMQ